MFMIWILLQFLVETCKTQIFQGVWNFGSASGNHMTLVSGLRSLALVSWRSLKIENSHPDASGAADAVEKSHQYICPWFPTPLKSWVAVTSVSSSASQGVFASQVLIARSNNFCSLEPRHIQHSRCNTLRSLNGEDKEHRHKFTWRVYLQLGAS